MAEETADKDRSIVDRWLGDQQQWQRTILTYLDSMAKNEDFLVHLGNAMRGSLLAGKPYPTAAAQSASVPATPADDRIDQLHFAIHQIEGQMQDVRMTLDEIRQALALGVPAPVKTASAKTASVKTAPVNRPPVKAAPAQAPRARTPPVKTPPVKTTAAKTGRPVPARRKTVKAPRATARTRQARG